MLFIYILMINEVLLSLPLTPSTVTQQDYGAHRSHEKHFFAAIFHQQTIWQFICTKKNYSCAKCGRIALDVFYLKQKSFVHICYHCIVHYIANYISYLGNVQSNQYESSLPKGALCQVQFWRRIYSNVVNAFSPFLYYLPFEIGKEQIISSNDRLQSNKMHDLCQVWL